MKDSLIQLSAKLSAILLIFKKYRVILFILLFSGIYVYLMTRINTLTQSEPDAAQLQIDPAQSIKRLKVDEEALARIRTLEAENIQVQSLFQNARQNPFSED